MAVGSVMMLDRTGLAFEKMIWDAKSGDQLNGSDHESGISGRFILCWKTRGECDARKGEVLLGLQLVDIHLANEVLLTNVFLANVCNESLPVRFLSQFE